MNPVRAMVVAGTAMVVACLGACGSAGVDLPTGSVPWPSAESAGRPLTDDEAARLAQSGVLNRQAGGAVFEAYSAFLAAGDRDTVSLRGEVNWVEHSGWAQVVADGVDAGVSEIVWSADRVFERRPAFDAVIAGRGGPDEPWIERPVDPASRQLDRLIAVIVGLAAEQPDNAVLIQQQPGSAFVRFDMLRGTPVEVLRYGTRNMHWLARDDGALVRFEGDSAAATAPIVVDIVQRVAVDVAVPAPESIVPVGEVAELVDALGVGVRGAAVAPADIAFVTAMVPHHRLGLDLLAVAEPRVDDVRVRRMVFEMSGYHHGDLHDLEHRLEQWGASPVEQFPGDLPDEVFDELVASTGSTFDRVWLEAMIEHHEGAVQLAETYLGDGIDPQLRDLASRTAIVQRAEMAAMVTLLADF